MKIKINAAARLLQADRDRFGELDLERQHPGTKAYKPEHSPFNPKEDELKKTNEMIDKIREQIKNKTFELRDKEGQAKETLKGVIEGLKKRANDLWSKVNPDSQPIYKV